MSKREAAQVLGVSTRGIERAVRRGQLPVIYRDSKHGKKAWFAPAELELYRQQQQVRSPVGFFSGAAAPTIGTLIPAVDMQPRATGEGGRRARQQGVPITDRLMLTVAEAAQLSGLPRKFLVASVRSGALNSVKIGRIAFIKRTDLNRFVEGL